MTKTRSQSQNPTIKEEIDNNKSKLTQLLHSNESTANSNNNSNSNNSNNENKSNKTENLKRRESKRILALTNKVKQETTYTEPTSLSPPTKKLKGRWITQEQIKNLIDYITKDKMTISKAAKEAGISYKSAKVYYTEYRNDPKHKLPAPKVTMKDPKHKFPVPKMAIKDPRMNISYKQIKTLIGYLVKDKMSLVQASKKMNISTSTASKYYEMYVKDPDHKMPKPGTSSTTLIDFRSLTIEHVKAFLDYVVNHNMTVTAASREVGISKHQGFKYYYKYINDPERKIPNLDKGFLAITNDQINTLIRCIVDDGMAITLASRKANMSIMSGRDYYRKYLNDPENFLRKRQRTDRIKQDRFKSLICCIFQDKLKVEEAAEKVGISKDIASKYYHRYIKHPEKYHFIPQFISRDATVSQQFEEKLKKMFEYITNDKMKVQEASKKAGVGRTAAAKYYAAYLRDPERKTPKQRRLGISKERVKKVVSYIVLDKMSTYAAAFKANLSHKTAQIYYEKYVNKIHPESSIYRRVDGNDETPEDLSQVFLEIHKKEMAAEKAQIKNEPKPLHLLDPAIKPEPIELGVEEKKVKRYNTRSRT